MSQPVDVMRLALVGFDALGHKRGSSAGRGDREDVGPTAKVDRQPVDRIETVLRAISPT